MYYNSKLKGFSDSAVISELAGLKVDLSRLMEIFAQLEEQYNKIERVEDLFLRGKVKKLKEVMETRSGAPDDLNPAMTKIETFQEMAKAEGYRQESLSEDQFGMIDRDRSPRSDYALYCELKLGRLHHEFSSFGSAKKFDNMLNRTVTEIDYEWLARRYTSALQLRRDMSVRLFGTLISGA